jgi:hypothetical protein
MCGPIAIAYELPAGACGRKSIETRVAPVHALTGRS